MNKILKKSLSVLGILIGSFITAYAIAAFMVPNKIAAGGASGIATLLYHLFGWSPGIILICINIPLLIISALVIDLKFSINSMLGGMATSLFVYLLEDISPVTTDPLLATLFGGIIVGVGMGIVFRAHGSTGGTDLLARILTKFTPLSIGAALLSIDIFIVTAAGIVFNIELAMFALINLFVAAKVIDVVQEGLSYTKAVLIITEKSNLLTPEILSQLERGVTEIYTRGGYSQQDRLIILLVIRRNELAKTKSIIKAIDPNAFVIVSDIHEVLGEGFKRIS